MQRVTLHCSSSGDHLSQIYSGFAMLASAGVLDVRLRRSADYSPGIMGSILRAEIGGRRVVYDTQDHAKFLEPHLSWATHYFKRSYEPSVVEASGRSEIVRPLGLNYAVYAPRDWHLRRIAWDVSRIRPRNARDVAVHCSRLSRLGSRLLGTEPGRATASVPSFEESPDTPGWAVLLLTRTWDPRRVKPHRAEMRAAMNATRVDSIRALRAELGPRFVGGLSPTADARRDYPDLVADDRIVKKAAYLTAMRSAAVCIASRGLLDTNGWRLAEYVAASRAIVTEPLAHTVPGDFAPDRNYLEFSTPSDLVDAVHLLLKDDERRAAMRAANHAYYVEHVRPDALVARTLDQLELD